MKPLFFFSFFLFLIVTISVVEDLLPPLGFLGEVRLFLLPMIFCFAIFLFSFPVSLLFALVTGLMYWLNLPLGGSGEVGLCWYLFFFLFWAILLQLFCEFITGVRWEVHAIATALSTASLSILSWILVNIHRGGFYFEWRLLPLILVPAGLACLIAPLYYAILQFFLPPPAVIPAEQK